MEKTYGVVDAAVLELFTTHDGQESPQLLVMMPDSSVSGGGWGQIAVRDRMRQAFNQQFNERLRQFVRLVGQVMDRRGWEGDWEKRLAHIILESSEFTEAWRGKRGNVVEEAADMLIACLGAIRSVEHQSNRPGYLPEGGLDIGVVIHVAERKLTHLLTSEPKPGEEYNPEKRKAHDDKYV